MVTRPRFMARLALFLLFFLYVYSVHFKGFPFNCNIILGICGGGMLLLKLIRQYEKIKTVKITGSFLWILVGYLVVVSVALVAICYNGTLDISIIKQVTVDLFCFFAFYAIGSYVRKVYGEISFLILAKYFTLVVVVQMFLSLLLSLVPGGREIAYGFLESGENVESAIERLEGSRLIGFGSAFFTAGIINSFALLLISVVLRNYRLNFREFFFFICSFLLIFSVGMMVARTTLIGLALSLVYLIVSASWFSRCPPLRFRRILKVLLLIGAPLFVAFFYLPDDLQKKIEVMSRFGYEMFRNYLESGDFSTSSTDVMKYMYRFPETVSTWMIGDGYFENPFMPGFYYMRTDIGFLRMIYYFGLIGLIAFTYFQAVTLYRVWKRGGRLYSLFFWACLGLYLVLNLKGMTDLFMYIIPFFFVDSRKGEKAIVSCS